MRAVYEAYQAAGPADIRTVLAAGKLGGCLFALKRYADAEPLLVSRFDAFRGAKDAQKQVLQTAGERVVKLYEAWGKPEKALEWREKLK